MLTLSTALQTVLLVLPPKNENRLGLLLLSLTFFLLRDEQC